jgi:hypothetical protein
MAIKGPNWLWSIDGHAKLSKFGIDIYGCIDAYSRRIIWLYIGIGGHTQLCVARQFIEHVRLHEHIPKRVRADRGSETPIIGDFVYELTRNTMYKMGEITFEQADQFDVKECWLFGTSMKNQRIEAWWNSLQRGQLRPWVVSKKLVHSVRSLFMIGSFRLARENRLVL